MSTEMEYGRSPAREALGRVLRNRIAMLGLVLVSAMVTLITLGPAFSPHDPTELKPWLDAQPPGFSHPDCSAENHFKVGAEPETTLRAARASRLTFALHSTRTERYRIVIRRGKIDRITRTDGAMSLETLMLDPATVEICEELEDGTQKPLPQKLVLTQGDAPPEGLLAQGQRVLLLQTRAAADTQSICTVQLAQGKVQKIEMDGEQKESVVLKAPGILRVTADGEPLVLRHLLGTDQSGRDVFTRVLYGGRISLMVGLVATLVSLLIGVSYGAISGYAGGLMDRAMMSLVDILYAIPFMFLVILLLVNFGRNIIMLFIALGAVQWLTMSRIVRGQILSLKESEFIEAARMSGARPLKIIFYHLVPHALGPVIVYATLTVPVVILEESFLAFIGLSVQYQGENLDSWGSLVNQGMQALGDGGARSWLLIWPSAAMVVTLLGLNCLGDGLRDVLDPRGKK